MNKIFLTMIAVAACSVTVLAQCVYPTDNVTINFKHKYPGLLDGEFTVSIDGNKVSFAQGNLQYDSDNRRWQFAPYQFSYIGNTGGNRNVSEEYGLEDDHGIADLFGWVGASSNWTNDLVIHGLTPSTTVNDKDGYGDGVNENIKSDWGTLPISNGGNTANSGWRTLTTGEWSYLFNTRKGAQASTVNDVDNIRFARATVNSIRGVIIFPDGGTFEADEFTEVGSPNTAADAFSTICSLDEWRELEKKGCVFLPVAGLRTGNNVTNAGAWGYYWSSSSNSALVPNQAVLVFIYVSALYPANSGSRYYGCSVRLVRDAE